ncbi:MAG: tail-specific protease [Desulfobulbus sp.]|nr:MAG: tail-specific protease [Desulfobulbus sp.]
MTVLRFLAPWLILFFLSLPAYSKSLPAQFDAGRNRLIAYMLSHQLTAQHFSHKSLDDISPAAYDLYLRQLDPRKRFLLKEDVAKLQVYADRIDDELRRGKVLLPDEGTLLFNRRVTEIMDMTGKLLDAGFDPNERDYLEFDPKKIEYADTIGELRERWRRILKMETLETYLDLLEQEQMNKAGDDAEKTPEPGATPSVETVDPALWRKALDKVREKTRRNLGRLLEETRQDHYDRFFDAVARAFDPHTNYMAPTSKEDFDIQMSGSLEGIGALLREEDGYIKVVRIIPGSAAERQGDLQAEDTILAAADRGKEPVDMTDMRIREAVSHIRGPKGSEVILTVLKPDGSKKVIPITRDVVQIEETYVKSEVLDNDRGNKFGYIRIPSFYRDFEANGPMSKARNVTDDFRKELFQLTQNKVEGIILDLRDNGGGSLSDAVAISGLFLPGGPVVQVKNAQGEIKILEDTDKNVLYDGPVIVLVNKFSASASEILAAALQDYGRALIVGGDHTHGKGTVQSIVDMNRNLPLLHRKQYEDMGALKVTIQKFYRINGESTQYKGIEPDIVVPTILDYLKSGEKHLDYSLPWDKVEPVTFTPWGRQPLNIEGARKAGDKWVASSAEFAKIREKTAKAGERAESTSLAVYLEGIRKERRELAALTENEGQAEAYLTELGADHYTGKDKTGPPPLRDQLGKDPYVQLALFLIDDLVHKTSTTFSATP